MNERDIIACFRRLEGRGRSDLLRGIGDDCAVIEKSSRRSWLVTMDTLVETVHFALSWHPPEKLGRKAVAVNVSDIAAMGGEPLFVFLSLGLPPGFDPSWVRNFAEGVTGACAEFGCMLAGGDTVRSGEGVLITLTVIGEMPADQVLYRRGAKCGDTVWVSGTLGMAAAGLEICRRGLAPDTEALRSMVEAHLNPQARVRLGRLLAESGLVHAMMDLSDGLATDLSNLCEQSDVGAVIHSALLPSVPALHEAASILSAEPLDLMIKGGEDYELLFTASADVAPKIIAIAQKVGVLVTPVGTVVDRRGVRLVLPSSPLHAEREIDISFAGFDHFPDK